MNTHKKIIEKIDRTDRRSRSKEISQHCTTDTHRSSAPPIPIGGALLLCVSVVQCRVVLLGIFHPSLTIKGSWIPWGGSPSHWSALWRQYPQSM